MVKNPPIVQENQVRSLRWEDPLEKGMPIHSSILAWRIPWTEEPGRLQSMGLKRVPHDWAAEHSCFHSVATGKRLQQRLSSPPEKPKIFAIWSFTESLPVPGLIQQWFIISPSSMAGWAQLSRFSPSTLSWWGCIHLRTWLMLEHPRWSTHMSGALVLLAGASWFSSRQSPFLVSDYSFVHPMFLN